MKILYIGQYSEGTTSRMRADQIQLIHKTAEFDVIDTNIPFYNTSKLFRSIGFRFKFGPLVSEINSYIKSQIKAINYDLIWIDKGIFIKPLTLKFLKQKTSRLVHFTPDMAFYENRSKYFEKSIHLYDYLITTKTKEIEFYKKLVSEEKIILTTQGFDKHIHKPHHEFEEKDEAIVFVGLAEPSRFVIIEQLLSNDFKIKLVGKGWESFVKKNKSNPNLEFIGNSVFGETYSQLISSSKFALGLLSKRFPEMHTTRTLEIPACRTALLTEQNEETQGIYMKNEVLFYKDVDHLIELINYYMVNEDELKVITNNGYQSVNSNNYDYNSIIANLLKEITK